MGNGGQWGRGVKGVRRGRRVSRIQINSTELESGAKIK